MNKKTLTVILLILMSSFEIFAQSDKRILSLQEVIMLARNQSPATFQANSQLATRYWQYRTYRSNYLPQLRLSGVLPDFNRSIDPILQPDGTEAFRSRSLATTALNLDLVQNVGLTGGEIFVRSQLQRIDVFGDQRRTTWLGNPVVIGFRQNIRGFNLLSWDRRIEPLRYREAGQQYVEDQEQVALDANNRFFDLLQAQVNLDIAKKNQEATDTLYKIAEGRYSLGKIAENDLLQLELSLMRSNQQVEQAKLDVESATLRLKNHLGISGRTEIELVVPEDVPSLIIDEEIAIDEARSNRQRVTSFERQMLEAERDVAQARGTTGFQADISGSFGLTESSSEFADIYTNPQDQERLRLGFSVPILDWGRTKSQVKTAEANYELISNTVKLNEQNFDQEIYLAVKQLRMASLQLEIAEKSKDIGQRRYDITKARYIIGKIGITDLNIAQSEKDEARRGYVSALRNFWFNYFNLRRLTLYDFQANEKITYDISY